MPMSNTNDVYLHPFGIIINELEVVSSRDIPVTFRHTGFNLIFHDYLTLLMQIIRLSA